MKNFIVLDVEGYSTCKPYDIGYIITNKKGEILGEKSLAIMPAIQENIITMCKYHDTEALKAANEMAHKNITEILQDTNNKYEKIYSIDEVFKILVNSIIEYNISEIWAYNSAFDKSAIHRLFSDEQNATLDKLITFYDIIPAILHTRLLTKKYVKFCIKNGYLTEKGNIQTKAEIVYKYLFNNLDFVEAHTGLEDCKIEAKILQKAMARKKEVNTEPCQAWKILRQFCETNDIDLPTSYTKE
jgi:hypothetical protein